MKCFIGRPRLSGSGGTIGYEKIAKGNLSELREKEFWWNGVEYDCYGIGHRLKIFKDDKEHKELYFWNNGWKKGVPNKPAQPMR